MMARVLMGAGLAALARADELNFLVMADWGGQPTAPYTTPGELSTAGGMGRIAETTKASFALAVGDNFYSSGIRTDVNDPRFKHTFEDVFTASSLQGPGFPFYVIAGNHDHGGNVTAQIAYTSKSTRWKYPEPWYTFSEDLGDGATLQVVMIDTVILSGNSDVRGEDGELVHELKGSELPGPENPVHAASQLQWLEATLKASNATFLLVAGHFPVWSICEHGPTTEMVKSVKPLLEQYHVTAFIAGHDHCMESFVDSGVDYHGMGASHSNDPSTAHTSAVPAGSLKFHAQGKSGGFGSFTVTPTTFVARHHEGSGALLYTHPTRGPRSLTPLPPPPPTPPTPTPPSPAPAPSPAPTPAGKQWSCMDGYDVDLHKLPRGLSDRDLMTSGGATVTACEEACNGTDGCVAVRWHETDKHCHTISASSAVTITHSQFMKALKQKHGYEACVLLKSL
jgi:tartrate-resistant acid phosphatase type 5